MEDMYKYPCILVFDVTHTHPTLPKSQNHLNLPCVQCLLKRIFVYIIVEQLRLFFPYLEYFCLFHEKLFTKIEKVHVIYGEIAL